MCKATPYTKLLKTLASATVVAKLNSPHIRGERADIQSSTGEDKLHSLCVALTMIAGRQLPIGRDQKGAFRFRPPTGPH